MSEKTTPPPSRPDAAFLALLCCPLCDDRPFLSLKEATNTLHCPRVAGHVYPIVDGFPDLRPPGETLDPVTPPPAQGGA